MIVGAGCPDDAMYDEIYRMLFSNTAFHLGMKWLSMPRQDHEINARDHGRRLILTRLGAYLHR
jgi:hypothetical protein